MGEPLRDNSAPDSFVLMAFVVKPVSPVVCEMGKFTIPGPFILL